MSYPDLSGGDGWWIPTERIYKRKIVSRADVIVYIERKLAHHGMLLSHSMRERYKKMEFEELLASTRLNDREVRSMMRKEMERAKKFDAIEIPDGENRERYLYRYAVENGVFRPIGGKNWRCKPGSKCDTFYRNCRCHFHSEVRKYIVLYNEHDAFKVKKAREEAEKAVAVADANLLDSDKDESVPSQSNFRVNQNNSSSTTNYPIEQYFL